MSALGPGRRVLAAVAATAVIGLTAACSSSTPASTGIPVSGTTTSGPTLTIGVSFDQPGIGMKSGDMLSGFDIDTATYIAKELGVPAQNIIWKEATPAERENLLEDGDVDLVVSSYSITDERKQKVDFAGPYFLAHQDLLVRRNDTSISGPETLDGKNLCSVNGTTSAQYIKDHYQGRIQLQEYAKFSECVDALAKGQVDAVTTDDVILAGFAAQPQYAGALKVVGKGFTDESYGVGIKKGDSDRVGKVNAALTKFISDGSWQKSLDTYVRPSGYSIPAPPTPGSS